MILIPLQGLDEKWANISTSIDDIMPYYMISNYGRVYNTNSGTLLTPVPNHSGYLQVGLMTRTGRVYRKIHRLVMMTFMYFTGCENYQVNHIDGDKTNNYIGNLEWCTAKENKRHSIITGLSDGLIGESNPKAKITENQARTICA